MLHLVKNLRWRLVRVMSGIDVLYVKHPLECFIDLTLRETTIFQFDLFSALALFKYFDY
jgi:hypothetical protein